MPVWPQITQNYSGIGDIGSRVGGGSGSKSGIGFVILVVDTTKVVGYTIGAIADYLAMLTLSVAQSPDHCDALPSILDLMSSSCGTRQMPAGITAGDLAFMKALYYKNTGLGIAFKIPNPGQHGAAVQASLEPGNFWSIYRGDSVRSQKIHIERTKTDPQSESAWDRFVDCIPRVVRMNLGFRLM